MRTDYSVKEYEDIIAKITAKMEVAIAKIEENDKKIKEIQEKYCVLKTPLRDELEKISNQEEDEQNPYEDDNRNIYRERNDCRDSLRELEAKCKEAQAKAKHGDIKDRPINDAESFKIWFKNFVSPPQAEIFNKESKEAWSGYRITNSKELENGVFFISVVGERAGARKAFFFNKNKLVGFFKGTNGNSYSSNAWMFSNKLNWASSISRNQRYRKYGNEYSNAKLVNVVKIAESVRKLSLFKAINLNDKDNLSEIRNNY